MEPHNLNMFATFRKISIKIFECTMKIVILKFYIVLAAEFHQ